MPYSGPEYWEVIYRLRAVADFGDLLTKAAAAKKALQDMSAAAKAEGDVETEAASKAAQAHKTDTTAINDESGALGRLADAAKKAQQWTEWGGRTDPGAHLADQAKLLEYKRLINIQDWLTFTNPQTAYAWRERERLQALEMNKAIWGGYTTPDQYLGYLQRQRTDLASLSDVLRTRAQIYRDNADAALAYANALAGTHKTVGQLGENLDLAGVSQFQAALGGLPDVVTTHLVVDDADALAHLAAYEALLRGVPHAVSTGEVLTAATAMGGVSLDQQPQIIPVSYGGPYKQQFAAIMAEVAGLSRLRAEIPVHFELPSAAEVASFVSQIPTAGITEPVHLVPQGGAVGVGPGPPPEVIAAWEALSGAESVAAGESKAAGTAEQAAGDSASGAAPKVAAAAAAWEALSQAEVDGAAAAKDAVAADEAAWQARVARIGAYYDALEKADAETLHAAKDFVPDPAAAQAWEQLTLCVDGFGKAVDAAATASGWQQLTLDSEYVSKDTVAWESLGSAEKAAGMSAADAAARLHALAAAADNSAAAVRLTVAAEAADALAAAQMGGATEKAAAAVDVLTAAWEKLSAAEKTAVAGEQGLEGPPVAAAGAGGAGKPPVTPVTPAAAGAEEPPEGAAAAWSALNDAEKAAGISAEDAAAKLRDMAAAATSAADASRYAYAAEQADAVANSQLSESAKAAALGLLAQAVAARTAGDASHYAWAAADALRAGETAAGDAALAAGVKMDAAALGTKVSFSTLNASGTSLITMLSGTGGLLSRLTLFGGLLAGLAGHVQIFHLIIDAVIELTIMFTLAAVGVAALSAAIGIFIGVADLSGDTLGKISDRLKAVYTASTATGQAIYPMTDAFDKLQGVIRPEVWELYGDALNLAGTQLGTIGKIAEATGKVLDQLAAKIVVFINTPSVQSGFKNLIEQGVAFATQFGRAFLNLGEALDNFLKAAQITHIAEDLLQLIVWVTDFIKWISELPAPLLAAGLAIHGLWLWGGLLTTMFLGLLNPIRDVALAMGGLSAASSNFANLGADASGFEKLKAVVQDVGAGFASLPGKISGTGVSLAAIDSQVAGTTLPQLKNLAAEAKSSGTALESLIPPNLAQQVELLTADMNAAQKEMLLTAAAGGATSDELDAMAGSEALATAGTFSLSGAVATLGRSMLALLASPVTWFIALAGAIGAVSFKIFTANDATQQWITGMDKALAKSSVYTVIGKTVQDLAAATTQLATAQKTGVGNAGELAAAQQDLTVKLGNELVNTAAISKAYGIDMPNALNLLQVAGVSTAALMSGPMSAAWKAAMVQVQGLVQGYAAMGQGLTQLQGDVSVQLVMNADQLASMAKLNTAWDSWLTLVTGGQTALTGFLTQLATVVTNTNAAGAAMDGLNAASLTLTGSWQTLVTNGGTLLDSIRSQSAVLMNGAQGTAILNQATKDLAATMIPLAGGSKEAQAGLLALVQEANPSITTWQELTKWVGPLGASGAAQNLTGIMTKLEVPLSDLQKDAKLLTTALQADLNPAMASAEFNAEGGQSAFNKFAEALKNTGPASQTTIQAGAQVAKILESVDGSAAAAKPQFIAWAESMGLSATAANKLWTEVSKGVTPSNALAQGLANSSKSAKDLGDNSTWAKLKDFFTVTLGQQGNNALKNFDDSVVRITKHLATVGWGTAYNGFQRDLAGPMTNWFTVSLPHAWDNATHVMATGWGTAYNGFQRDLAGPVTHWLTVSLPHDESKAGDGLATAWGTAWNGFNRDLGGPIEDFFTKTLPGFFGRLRSSWGTAISGMWHSWSTNLVGNIEHDLINLIPGWFAGTGTGWSGTVKRMWSDTGTFFTGPFSNFFTKTVPGFFIGSFSPLWSSTAHGMWSSFTNFFSGSFSNFFTKTVPGLFTSTGDSWGGVAHGMWSGFSNFFTGPFVTFFSKTVPNWFNSTGSSFSGLVSGMWNSFVKWITNNFVTFWTKSVPNWFNNTGSSFAGLVSGMWNSFTHWMSNNFVTFWTKSVPNWFSSTGSSFASLASGMWNNFYSHVITPMGHWFSQSLPNAIQTAFRDSINWVINNVINKTIGFINNDILSHLPGSLHVSTIGNVAAGGDIPVHAGGRAVRMPGSGSIPGNSAVDGTHIMAMGGEYMLRQPARMALERTYGANFLNTLNQADSWLGSGSRGTMASQRPRRHAAGGEVGGDEHSKPFPFPSAQKYASGGQIAATAEHFIGAPYVYGGTTPSGWDCSGFVEYVLSGLGWKNVPRTSEAQYAWTQHEGSPGVGDLVFAQFPGDNASPGHVGFYIGNGQVLSARDPAEGTGVDSLSSWSGHIVGYGHEPNPTGVAGQILGGIAEAWQGIEGLLNAAGDALTGNTAALAGDVAGGAGALLKLAQQGAASVFGAVWDHTIKPLIGVVPGDTIPGAILQGGAADIRQGILNFMTGQDQNAQNQAAAQASFGSAVGKVTPASGSAAQAQAFASAHLSQFGWGQDEMPALIDLWDQESGWNDNAVNPSSGAYGIPQALPSAQDHPYNLGDYANQVLWGLNYIKQRYGNPALAWAHELSNNWYAAGGPVGGDGASMAVFPGFAQGDVIAGIEAATGNTQIREAMALGSYLESGWSDTAVGDSGTSFGPFQIHLPAHPGVTASQAENPAWAAKYMLPAYTSGVSAVPSSVWSSNPETASEEAAYNAERPAQTYFASHGTAAVNAAWNAVKTALGTTKASAAPAVSVATVPSGTPSSLTALMSKSQASYPGIGVPDITGHQAGPAHNMLVAAGLVPTAAAGQIWYWYATGSAPPPDSSATPGMSVAILADPGAAAQPVRVPDLKDYAAGTAHDILVAAGFVPAAVAGQQPWWKVTGTSPAAGSVAAAGSRVTIIATASIVQVPDLKGYTAGAAHDALVAAGLVPTAAAGQIWYWFVTGTSPAAGSLVAPGTKVTILASAQAPSPGGGAGGTAAAANWPAASAALPAVAQAQSDSFWALNAFNSWPAIAGDAWAQWYADLGILQTNQNALSGEWGTISPLLTNPAGLTTTNWLTWGSQIGNQLGWIADNPTPPASVWGEETSVGWPAGFRTSKGATPGHIPPTSWAAWKYANAQWTAARNALQSLQVDEKAAYGAWEELWGPAGSITTAPPTPGLQVIPGGGGPITVNLEPLIPGGPAFPVMALTAGSLSSTGSGFAAGGGIPLVTVPDFASGGGLGDVAGMFALGGVVPQGPAAMPARMANLAGSGAAELPRTLASGAGGSGDRVGVKVGNLTIHNPVAERPSDSITRSTNRLSFLAGRQMA